MQSLFPLHYGGYWNMINDFMIWILEIGIFSSQRNPTAGKLHAWIDERKLGKYIKNGTEINCHREEKGQRGEKIAA